MYYISCADLEGSLGGGGETQIPLPRLKKKYFVNSQSKISLKSPWQTHLYLNAPIPFFFHYRMHNYYKVTYTYLSTIFASQGLLIRTALREEQCGIETFVLRRWFIYMYTVLKQNETSTWFSDNVHPLKPNYPTTINLVDDNMFPLMSHFKCLLSNSLNFEFYFCLLN